MEITLKQSKYKKSAFTLAIFGIFLFLYALTDNPLFLFILNFSTAIMTVVYFRISIYSVYAVLANYPMFNVIWAYYFKQAVSSFRISEDNIAINEILISITIFNFFLMALSGAKESVASEKLLINFHIQENPIFNFLAPFLIIIFTIISAPHIPFLHISNFVASRQSNILPGDAWNYMATCIIIFYLMADNKIRKGNRWGFIIILCSFVWLFGNAARVDTIGILTFCIFRYTNFSKIKTSKKIAVALVAFLILLIFNALGDYRVGNNGNFVDFFFSHFGSNLIGLTNQKTSADIIHIFNTGFIYVQHLGLMFGKTYHYYAVSIIPFSGSSVSAQYLFTSVLNSYILNYGGGYFLTEPYINFGYIGIAVFSFLFILITKLIIKYNNRITFVLYAFLWAVSFRFFWYGLIYVERSVLQILPIFAVFYYVCYKLSKKYVSDKHMGGISVNKQD